MATFGRNSHRAFPAAPSASHAGRVVIVGFIIAIALLLDPAKQLYADRTTPLPRDFAAGLLVSASPYVAPPGCPPRRWMEGDYLPAPCFVGWRIDHSYGEQIGLERPQIVGKTTGRRKWRSFHQRQWVRAGSDALLLVGPKDTSGKILYVARGRFSGSGAKIKSDGRTFRTPPSDFIVRSAFNLAFTPIAVLSVIGIVLIYRCTRLDKRSDR